MSDTYCTDCKRNTEVVFDHAAGDTVCSECGLVLKSRSIDESSEWRTFADESGDTIPIVSVDQLTPSWLTLLFRQLFLGVLMVPMRIHLWPACRIGVGIQTGYCPGLQDYF